MITIAKKTICFIVVFVLVVSYFVYSYFLSSDGGGANRVREHIDAVRGKQQSVIERLEFIEGGLTASIATAQEVSRGLENIEGSVGRAQDRIGASEVRAIRSAELIGQGQSILECIRTRGQK